MAINSLFGTYTVLEGTLNTAHSLTHYSGP